MVISPYLTPCREYFMETLGADKLLATYLIRPVTAILFT